MLPVSLEIGLYAFAAALVAGVLAALRQNTWPDYLTMGAAMTGVVVPGFVKAPLLVPVFTIWLKWLPAGGRNGGAAHPYTCALMSAAPCPTRVRNAVKPCSF